MQRQRIFSLRKILPEYLQVWRFFRKYEVVCRMNHTQYLCNAKRERQKKEAAMKKRGSPRDDREMTERVASGNGVVTELISVHKD